LEILGEGKAQKRSRCREAATLRLFGITPSLPGQNLEARVGIGPFRRGFPVKTIQFGGLLKRYLT